MMDWSDAPLVVMDVMGHSLLLIGLSGEPLMVMDLSGDSLSFTGLSGEPLMIMAHGLFVIDMCSGAQRITAMIARFRHNVCGNSAFRNVIVMFTSHAHQRQFRFSECYCHGCQLV